MLIILKCRQLLVHKQLTGSSDSLEVFVLSPLAKQRECRICRNTGFLLCSSPDFTLFLLFCLFCDLSRFVFLGKFMVQRSLEQKLYTSQ